MKTFSQFIKESVTEKALQDAFNGYCAEVLEAESVASLDGFLDYCQEQSLKVRTDVDYDDPIVGSLDFYALCAGSQYEIIENGHDDFEIEGKK